ncbi:MAG: ABC transporter ATP-binding protein [Oscillochloris sp.]|nr:ABC transporter ATP-binding protein [Oscillochloris sp.]
MITLTLEDVAATYGDRPVLSGVDLTLHGGEVLVVSGPNGSGKSTLLRLMAGLQSVVGGRITYRYGESTFAPREAQALIGWVAPDLMLYRELTARENLRFFASVRRITLTDEAIDQLLAEVGLAQRGDDLLAAYSSGMAQRLRYAYALLHRPPVLLLDEPTLTLDARGAAVVDQVITAQRRRGIVVLATNDPRELRYGDLILRLGD